VSAAGRPALLLLRAAALCAHTAQLAAQQA
jgi:hypothetical protein